MSVVDVDKIEQQRKIREELAKKAKKENEKIDKKVKVKAKKNPTGKRKPIPQQMDDEEEPEYRANEWVTMAYGLGFKAMSLPAGKDREQFEAELKGSNDMKNMMAHLPLKTIYEEADPKFLYALSYASKLAKVKLQGMGQRSPEIKTNDQRDVETGVKDMEFQDKPKPKK